MSVQYIDNIQLVQLEADEWSDYIFKCIGAWTDANYVERVGKLYYNNCYN